MTAPLRIVLLGTGNLALPVLRSLYESPHEVAGLVTQPERTGRGHHQHQNPLKEVALEHATPVFQPEDVNAADSLARLREFAADVFVVAAYGQILSDEILAMPRLGCINVHASLLPKYRGASPIHQAILNGDRETGITIIQLEPALDAGPILDIEKLEIRPDETTGELEQRLAELAVPVTLRAIEAIAQGRARGTPQDPAGVTRARKLKKQQGAIDWSQPAEQIERHVRAMQPWPTAFTFLLQEGRAPLRLIVLRVRPAQDSEFSRQSAPGTVVYSDSERLVVQTGRGTVDILSLQPEGKRVMEAPEFLRGARIQPGDRFVPAPVP